MPIYTVTDDVISSDKAAEYFTRADRRVMVGLRAALELLGLPVPDYAIRRKPGRTPASGVAAAYAADNPRPFPTVLAPRKPNASPEAVIAAKVRRAQRSGLPSDTYVVSRSDATCSISPGTL